MTKTEEKKCLSAEQITAVDKKARAELAEIGPEHDYGGGQDYHDGSGYGFGVGANFVLELLGYQSIGDRWTNIPQVKKG